jgi:Protein of unknown function (DUF3071)
MRALRVVGLAEDGSVICETEAAEGGAQPERFSLKADDKLRAAARGDLPRLGQIEIELESQMRPREIQARIRAGASVEQVAQMAGMPAEKVDRFAYPVLLERSRTAELAQRAHPVRDDGPDVRTLGEVVANTFGQRGQDYTAVAWDSWKGEDGKWVVQLRWTAGRSDNRAHWTFHPGAHGGTVTVLDELAADLIDPTAGKPLRTVRPVTALAEQALQLEEQAARHPEPAPPARRPEPAPAARRPEPAPPARRAEPAPAARRTEPPAPARRTEPAAATRRSEPAPRHTEPATRRPEPARRAAEQPQLDEPAAAVPEPEVHPEPVVAEATGTTEAAPTRRGRNNRPIVPSWEDVLLGVRSNRG